MSSKLFRCKPSSWDCPTCPRVAISQVSLITAELPTYGRWHGHMAWTRAASISAGNSCVYSEKDVHKHSIIQLQVLIISRAKWTGVRKHVWMYDMTISSKSVFSKLPSFLFSSQPLDKSNFITVAYAVTGRKKVPFNSKAISHDLHSASNWIDYLHWQD